MTWVSDAAVRRLREVANRPELPGTRYRIIREIGRGGMGTVYLGHDDALGRDVAIKVTSAERAGGALEARMRVEARVLAGLEHPGIVPIHDVGTLADGRLFTVMKLVRGVTLAEHLGTVTALAERLRIFESICEAAAFAHDRGTVHRDLKPNNVMIGGFGEVLVMDWGVAKVLTDRSEDAVGPDVPAPERMRDAPVSPGTDPGTVMGTPGYMAPEQAAGMTAVDARADVYALGGILFGMLTNAEPPLAAVEVPAHLGRHRGVPKRLRAICLKAMAADAGERYGGAADLARDVARFRRGEPVDAYPETVLDRAGRLAVTYRTPIILVLTYLVVRAAIAVLSRR